MGAVRTLGECGEFGESLTALLQKFGQPAKPPTPPLPPTQPPATESPAVTDYADREFDRFEAVALPRPDGLGWYDPDLCPAWLLKWNG
ncbi:MAG: hypothetical protein HJJLKODD_02521 [Phycisphaerae bacterium]|nr:hypothetical protein [Phycisphaerae bacterium]